MSAPAPRRTGRSILAVVAGFLVVFVLSTVTDLALHATGVYPPPGQAMSTGLFVLATAYRLIYTVAGGWVTAYLAPGARTKHAVVLGLIGTLAALAGVIATWNLGPEFGPKWYPISLVVTALPCTWLGGKLAGGDARS